MTQSSHPSVRRRLLKWILCAVLVVLGVFLLSNLWLSSRWAAGMAEDHLERRSGLEWEVGSMSWSPWNGFSVHDMVVEQPEEIACDLGEAMLTVKMVQVRPYWRPLFGGRLYVKDLVVDSPQGVIAVEMLGALAMQGGQSGSVPLTTVKRTPEGTEKSRVVDESAKAGGKSPEKSTKAESKPPVNKGNSAVAPTKGSNKGAKKGGRKGEGKVQRTPLGMPMHIRITGGRVRIVSSKMGTELLKVEPMGLDLVLMGEDSTGYLDMGKVTTVGGGEEKDVRQVLKWKRPYLQWQCKAMDLEGIKVGYTARVGLSPKLASGKGVLANGGVGQLPFVVDIQAPVQAIKSLSGFGQVALNVSADRVSGRLRCSGVLQQPMSWRGDMQVQGSRILVKEKHGGRDVVFDEVVLPAVFRHGRLNWGGVRLIGEDLAVLGNGQISVGGGVLAVTRIVVSPEVSDVILRGVYGAVISRNGYVWWENLDTEDRKFRDLLIHGDLRNPAVDIGYDHRYQPLWQTVRKTLTFVRQEMKEEGRDIREIPVEAFIPES